jgi:hypothetical protein
MLYQTHNYLNGRGLECSCYISPVIDSVVYYEAASNENKSAVVQNQSVDIRTSAKALESTDEVLKPEGKRYSRKLCDKKRQRCFSGLTACRYLGNAAARDGFQSLKVGPQPRKFLENFLALPSSEGDKASAHHAPNPARSQNATT